MVVFATMVDSSCRGRSYFSTEGKRVGLGPRDVSPGDLVCVFEGSPTPYVLRATASGTSYTFIGECYVHGLMNSEALDMRDEGIVESETFIIE